MTTLGKIVARNSLAALISKFLVKLLSFGFTIWMARTLGGVNFGRYALIWSFVTVFATCSDFGLGMYLIREMAKDRDNTRYLAGNVIVFRLLLALVTLLVVLTTAHLVGYSDQLIWYIFLAASILFLYAVQDPLDSVLQANERVDLSSLLRIVGQLAFVVLGVIFLLGGWGITGLILASLANVLIAAGLSWHLIRRYLGGVQWYIQPRTWLHLLLTAFPFGLIGFALNWSQKIDTVILSLFWADEVIGWYNAAYSLVLGIIIISNAINVALYPTMSKEFAAGGRGMPQMHRHILKYLFIIAFPMAVFFFGLSRPIIERLYGPLFAQAALPLMILAWGVPFMFVSEFLRYMALVVGRESQAARAVLLASLVNIMLNFLFIPWYGMVAAATTTVLTEVLLVVIYLWQLRREISLGALGAACWKPGLAAGLLLAVLLLAHYVPLPGLVIILGGVMYGVLLFLLGGFGPEEKTLVSNLLRQILSPSSHRA